MIVCKSCRQAIQSRGERLTHRPLDIYDEVETIEENGEELVKCEWCDEFVETWDAEVVKGE